MNGQDNGSQTQYCEACGKVVHFNVPHQCTPVVPESPKVPSLEEVLAAGYSIQQAYAIVNKEREKAGLEPIDVPEYYQQQEEGGDLKDAAQVMRDGASTDPADGSIKTEAQIAAELEDAAQSHRDRSNTEPAPEEADKAKEVIDEDEAAD